MYTIKKIEEEIWLCNMRGVKVKYIGKHDEKEGVVDTALGAGHVEILQDNTVVASSIEVSAMMHAVTDDIAL
jgi:hypothetical protein